MVIHLIQICPKEMIGPHKVTGCKVFELQSCCTSQPHSTHSSSSAASFVARQPKSKSRGRSFLSTAVSCLDLELTLEGRESPFCWMDLLFIVSPDFCLLSHKTKSLPNLSSTLPLVRGLEKSNSVQNTRPSGMEGRYSVPTLESGKASSVLLCACVCVDVDRTHHSQPTDLTCYRGNHTSWSAMPHTRQTHVGEIMVCL